MVQLILCDQDHSDPYAALSYCWGKQQTFLTTQANIQDMLRSIRLPDLPQTIRDAIRVARSLGLDYLWVDALCIIQDSKEDQLNEIAKMGHIYQSAIVTIAADRAADCRDGFLDDTAADDPDADVSSSGSIPYRTLGGQLGSVKLRILRPVPYSTHLKLPIHRRAWTYQEAFFARRRLSFANRLLWQCQSGHDSAVGCTSHDDQDSFSKSGDDILGTVTDIYNS